MDFSSLAGAGLSLAGGLFGGSKRDKSAKQMAEAQMAFQREVLQNKHQWEVGDLRAAGLNPILSATSGMGGGASGGATYTPENYVGDAVNSAVAAFAKVTEAALADVKKDVEEVKVGQTAAATAREVAETALVEEKTKSEPFARSKMSSETNFLDEQANSAKTLQHLQTVQAAVENMRGHNIAQDTNVKLATEKLLRSQNVSEALRGQLLNLEIPVAVNEAVRARNRGEINESTLGKFLTFVEQVTRSAGISGHYRMGK